MTQNFYQQEIINPGDRASQLAKEVCFGSHKNSPTVTIIPHQSGNFRGPVGFMWQKHILTEMMKNSADGSEWSMLEEVENDGAGGKPQFFSLIGTEEVFKGLGWEIITMVADDFVRSGRLPVIMDNEINVKKLTDSNFHLFRALITGYGQALKQSNLVNITGEIAILKHSVTAFCDTGADEQLILNWGASCVGLARKELLIDNSKIQADMPIVGFEELGYRCNGGTFFTNLIIKIFGPEIDKILNNPRAVSFVKKLTVPSKSYTQIILHAIGWQSDGRIIIPPVDIAGIAHITGGGIWGKFKEILPKGVGAHLDNMPKPAEVLLEAQKLSEQTDNYLTDFQAYETLHGGCGMLIVCTTDKDAEKLIQEANHDGVNAQVVGRTIKSDQGEIFIQSRFNGNKKISSLCGE